MPCYNAANYISQSIESVINQTYTNWELIIVDDGSTDNSKSICHSYLCRDNRIRYIYQENSKQAIARNKGITKANGELIAFLDADDLWLPQKLEVTLNQFDLNQFDLIFTNSFYTDSIMIDLKCQNYSKMGIIKNTYFGKNGIISFLEGNKIPILTAIVKKTCLLKVNGFDSTCVPAEDYDLWIRLLKNGYKLQSIEHALAIYRIHENSATTLDRLATSSVLNLLKKNFTKLDIQNLNAKELLKKWIIREIELKDTKTKLFHIFKIIKHFGFFNIYLRLLYLNFLFLPISILKRGLIKYIKSA